MYGMDLSNSYSIDRIREPKKIAILVLTCFKRTYFRVHEYFMATFRHDSAK